MWELMNDPSLIDSIWDLFLFLTGGFLFIGGVVLLFGAAIILPLFGIMSLVFWLEDGGIRKKVLPWLRKERRRAQREEALAQEFTDSRSEQ